MKKVPLRTCVVSHEKCEKKDLLRVVRTPLGEVLYDSTGKLNGKGAYLKKSIEVINKATVNIGTIYGTKNAGTILDKDNYKNISIKFSNVPNNFNEGLKSLFIDIDY